MIDTHRDVLVTHGEDDQLASDRTRARAIALSTGDLSRAVTAEVRTVLAASSFDVLAAIDAGLRELELRDLISSDERPLLAEVSRQLVGSIRGDVDPADAFTSIGETYGRLIIDPHATPTALSIASVANASFSVQQDAHNNGNAARIGVTAVITPLDTGTGAVIGGIIGGIIGGLTGGWVGAGLGAAIGAAVGGAIGWCNEKGK